MTSDTHSRLFQRIVEDLAEFGWSLQAHAFSATLTRQLAQECRQRVASGGLLPAGIGRGGALTVREETRGDHIQWLETGQALACDRYLHLLDELRQAINQSLYLGLQDFEGHFACYPPGSFYRRHLDRFRDDDRRTVTSVFFLNEDWNPEEGGALRLYLGDGAVREILPEAGTLVLFLAADLPHEVLPTKRERLSLTGWFRRHGATHF
jgi:SM-20-related protein